MFSFFYKKPQINFNRSEVKEERGWFTTWSSAGDEIPEEKPVTRSPTRITRPARIRPKIVTEPIILPTQLPSTQLRPRPIHPTPRIFPTPRNEIKVYTRNHDDDDDESSQMSLPPTTTALVIKKPVK